MPSVETTVSNPRTARLERTRSTMLGSSSTSRARVLTVASGIGARPDRQRGEPLVLADVGTLRVRSRRLDGQADPERRPGRRLRELDLAAVRLDDPAGDREPEPGAGGARAVAAGRVKRRRGQCGRE